MAEAIERSPAPVSRRPTGSWRARRQESRPSRRRARRLLAALGVFALLAIFAYLLLAPLGRPKAALILARPIAAASAGEFGTVPFGARDLAAVAAATDGLLIAPAVDLTSERPPSETFGPLLHNRNPDADVLVAYVSADAASENGRAVLLWGTDAGETVPRRYPIRDLLAALADHPAATKVLILEAGDAGADRRAGRLADNFSQLLSEDCRNGREGVWVLVSHQPGETSHVSPALDRSVFGYWVGRGLGGAADLDRNGFVHLKELHQYVMTGVSAWVRQTTGGRESQTPTLLACGSSETVDADPLLLPASRWFRDDDEHAAFRTALDTAARQRESLAEADAASSQTGAAEGAPQPMSASPASGAAATSDAGSGAATADAAASPAGNSPDAAAGSTTADAADVSVIASQRPPTALELLEAGWSLRDELEAGTAARTDPRRDAPHLWRAYVQRLLDLEAAVHTGSADERTLATEELRRLVLPLRRWAAGGGPEPDAAEPVRSLTNARPQRSAWQPVSLGMEEAQAVATGSAVAPDVAEVITEFDRLIDGGDVEAFTKWLAELPPEHDRYVEVTLARLLTATPGLDKEVLRDALATRRLAEQVASNVEAAVWLTAAIEEADLLRRKAERLLLDGIGWNRQSVAQNLLARAQSRYNDAALQQADLREAWALRTVLLARAPELVAWHRRSSRLPGPHSPKQADILALLRAAGELASVLEAPATGTIDGVRAAAAKARTLLAVVEAGLDPDYVASELIAPPDSAVDFLRIRALLSTTLPAASERNDLREAARRADESLAARLPWSNLRPDPMRSGVVEPAGDFPDRIEIEYRLALLGIGEASGDRNESLTTAYQQTQSSDSIATSAADRHFEAVLGEFWRRTLPAIAGSTPPASADRRAGLALVQSAERALRMLDPRDALSVTSSPIASLRNERLAGLLQWQARRFERDRDNAPGDERRTWQMLASASRQAALQVSKYEFNSTTPASLLIDGPGRISLESRDAATIEMTVESRTDEPLDVWLVVDHDPALVSITKPSTDLTPAFRLRQQSNRGELLTVAPTRLNRPDLEGDEPAFRLPPRGRHTIEMPLVRESGSGRPTRLIVRAIARAADSRDLADDVSIVRDDVVVALPSVAPAVLIVEGPPGCVGGQAGRPIVSPFPNRVTPFQLFLANRTGSTATVDVEIFAVKPVSGSAVAPRATGELPTEIGIDKTAAASLLAHWTDGTILFSVAELSLPNDGAPVPLPFPKPVPSPAPAPAVEQGLLVVVTDRATGRISVQPIEFRPQHPRRYVEPIVRYDADAERIDIRVVPRSEALLPPGGSRVTCEVVGTLPPEATRRLDGVVAATDRPAELFVETAGVREDAVVLKLSVDGYPRAFHYRVPLAGSRSSVPPETGAAAVRIRAPLPGGAYQTPIASVPASIEVDAPVGARWFAGDAVEIGFDRDRDRELRGEETIRLRSDRQITVSLRALAPGGTIAVACRVSDFRIDVPADHLDRGRVNLIGRLVTAGRSVWSAPVELTFDDVPPPIKRLYLSHSRVVAGDPLRVIVEASDSGLSGVAQVLVGVDLERTGQFGAEPKPVPAVNERGRWIATLDTAALLPGAYFVLVRAIDEVGIPGPYSRERFEVVTPQQMAAFKAAAVNQLGGYVNYRGRPMTDFEVAIEPLPPEAPAGSGGPPAAPPAPAPETQTATIPPTTTDDSGAFTFARVPPGRYRVTTSGLYANGRREGSVEVTVPPSPAEVPPVEIEVDPRQQTPGT